MKVLVYGKYLDNDDLKYVKQVIELIDAEGIDYKVNEKFAHTINENEQLISSDKIMHNHTEVAAFSPDICISMGGDGTILTASTIIQELEIPILGINLGRLGFLASTEKVVIKEAIQKVKNRDYVIEKRTMISLQSNIPAFVDETFALNDFTLHKRDTSSMVTIHTYINGEFLNSYWADGIIVSTPTGSTGYNLSCGGPIIYPGSQNFVITPVAPHNLNVRPLIVSDSSTIALEIKGRSENFMCTLDSRYETVTSEHKLSISKCAFHTNLVRLENSSFLQTMRDKLAWGRDSRN